MGSLRLKEMRCLNRRTIALKYVAANNNDGPKTTNHALWDVHSAWRPPQQWLYSKLDLNAPSMHHGPCLPATGSSCAVRRRLRNTYKDVHVWSAL